MEPHARVERCLFRWERIALTAIGHNFIGEPFRPNLITYWTYGVMAASVVSQIYTFAMYELSYKIFAIISHLLTLQVWLSTKSINVSFEIFTKWFLASGHWKNVSHPLCWWHSVDFELHSKAVQCKCQDKMPSTCRIFRLFWAFHRNSFRIVNMWHNFRMHSAVFDTNLCILHQKRTSPIHSNFYAMDGWNHRDRIHNANDISTVCLLSWEFILFIVWIPVGYHGCQFVGFR